MGTATTIPLPRDTTATQAVAALLDAWWAEASAEEKMAAYQALHRPRRVRVHLPGVGQLALDAPG